MKGEIGVVITAVGQPAPGIREFTLARADGGAFPPFSGGSHILVALPVRGRTHLNAYSLMGDPAERGTYRIAVKREPDSRGGSQYLHDQAGVGTRFAISHPVNLFPIVRTARKHLLLAGGIGVTPILAQARQLKGLGARFEVHYGFRDPEQGAFSELLRAAAGPHAHCYVESLGQRIDFAGLFANQPLGTHVYVCGPEGMRLAAFGAAERLGWPASHLHYERFLAPLHGKAFRAELRRSGRHVEVLPDQSLLEAIEQAGVQAPYLCRGGACGQCETEVLEAHGTLLHHDVYLSDHEKAGCRKIMPCVSRLDGERLVLNI